MSIIFIEKHIETFGEFEVRTSRWKVCDETTLIIIIKHYDYYLQKKYEKLYK